MERRDFLQGILAAAAAVATGVRTTAGGVVVVPAVPASASTQEASETIRIVYSLLRECRITQVVRRGENTLSITYERDGKRRHEGPLFDWIEAHAKPTSICVTSSVDSIDVRHLGDPLGLESMTPTVQVEVEWFVADIERCPIIGYHEVTA